MRLENYIQVSGPLFEAVQKNQIFSDPKTFVDSYPKLNPKEVLALYEKEKCLSNFDLKQFVLKHFIFPEEENSHPPHTGCITDYIYSMWDILQKEMTSPSPYGTLIPLPKPHIVPGGRFRECFYWDSYFTALGLASSGQIESIKDMVTNFAFLIDRFGFIPNGNRVYFASRSQPPYFSYVLRLMLEQDEEEWALTFMPQLEAEYAYWMKGAENLTENGAAHQSVVRIDEETILNRYYDEKNVPRPEAFLREIKLSEENPSPEFFRNLRAACASGWDFSSRWLEDPAKFQTIWALDLVPVDLNCLMYHLEWTLSDFAKRLNNKEKENHYSFLAEKRKEAILRLFWSEEKEFFFDYHFLKKKQTNVWSLAGVSPLFNSLASKKQAEMVTRHLKEKFLLAGGFTTTLYEGIHQWDSPNGWAPLEWITIQGLLNYGENALAKEAAKRFVKLADNIYKQTGKVIEKYNVRDCSSLVARGEYNLQEGFGWTNGVILALIELFQLEGF